MRVGGDPLETRIAQAPADAPFERPDDETGTSRAARPPRRHGAATRFREEVKAGLPGAYAFEPEEA